MDIYFASPNTQQQAEHCTDENVLMSYACFSKWLYQYAPTFKKILIDSGAYSEYTSGKKINLEAYRDWAAQWRGIAEAIAGLDDIAGDYKRSLKNYEAIPYSFPTWHDSDPVELIDELSAMAIERKTWLAIGLTKPRTGKESILRNAIERIPDSIHLHGFALRQYSHIQRFDSFDSTNWWRDAMGFRKDLPFLHFGECLELVKKRYKRETRTIIQPVKEGTLFG